MFQFSGFYCRPKGERPYSPSYSLRRTGGLGVYSPNGFDGILLSGILWVAGLNDRS